MNFSFSKLNYRMLSKNKEAIYLFFSPTKIASWLWCSHDLLLSHLIKPGYKVAVYFCLNLFQIGEKQTKVEVA